MLCRYTALHGQDFSALRWRLTGTISTARISANSGKLFCSQLTLNTAAPLVIAVVTSRSNRGSFLVAKSNAGGNRATGRQRRLIEIKLDSLTP
jgi:hypothetical protein